MGIISQILLDSCLKYKFENARGEKECTVNITWCSLSVAFSLVWLLLCFGLKFANITESIWIQRNVQHANDTVSPFSFIVLLGGVCTMIQQQSSMSLGAQEPSFISFSSFALAFKLDNVLSF